MPSFTTACRYGHGKGRGRQKQKLMSMLKKVFVGAFLAAAVLMPLGMLLLTSHVAHAQVPTPSQWASQVGSSTDDGAAMVSNTVFTGGALKFIVYILLVGVLVGLIIWGIHSIGFRRRV